MGVYKWLSGLEHATCFSFIFISYNLSHHFFLLFIMKNNLLSFYVCECAPAVNMRSLARRN